MPFSFHLAFPQGRPESGLPFENSLLHQQTPGYILPAFYLSAIYRCVTRSCNKVVRKNLYHRKFSGIPRLSRYSCRNFSLSSSRWCCFGFAIHFTIHHCIQFFAPIPTGLFLRHRSYPSKNYCRS